MESRKTWISVPCLVGMFSIFPVPKSGRRGTNNYELCSLFLTTLPNNYAFLLYYFRSKKMSCPVCRVAYTKMIKLFAGQGDLSFNDNATDGAQQTTAAAAAAAVGHNDEEGNEEQAVMMESMRERIAYLE
jgi:hypothetical protein